MTYNVNDIAKKIIAASHPDCGDIISNMKLQKMLYYMQGFHLAVFDEPLFLNDIEAWMYGPVVPEVYNEYKECGSSAIIPEEDFTVITLSDPEEDLFNQVYDAYGQFSAYKLMEMTHNEAPWRSVETGVGSVIPVDVIKSYFLTQLDE